MKVRVRFFAFFRRLFGEAEREVDLPPPVDVRGLLDALCDSEELRSELFDGRRLKPRVVVMKNGRSVLSLQGLKTSLSEGDTVAVFPFPGGG